MQDNYSAIDFPARPLKNVPFCPITASDLNIILSFEFLIINPEEKKSDFNSTFKINNSQYIPPDEIFAFLVLEQNLTLFKGL